jgi:hypothetical protein
MLDTLKLQMTFPSSAYAPTTTYNALKRGDSMTSSQYVLAPSDVKTATTSDVVQALASYNLNRRSPGQRGTNRAQVLIQFVCLDAKGSPAIFSFSGVLATPNGFVPAAGTAVDVGKLAKAAVAGGVSMLLNPDADTTTPRGQSSVTDLVLMGVLP